MGLNTERFSHDPLSRLLLRVLCVTLVAFLLAILDVMPIFFGQLSFIKPDFLFCAIFYWAILRDRFCPLFVTFLAGLLLDILSGGILGAQALLLVATQIIVSRQRKFFTGQPFAVIWACLSLAVVTINVVQWMIFSLWSWHVIPIIPALMTALATVLVFPFIAPIYALFLKALAIR